MKVLVIDVGGTEIKYAAFDENLNMEGYDKITTPYDRGVDGFLDTLEEIYNSFHGRVVGISICLPGIIDSEVGNCISGGTLEYNVGQPVGELLAKRCGVPVYLENDGKCAVLAEYWKGALKDCQIGVLLALGTAVAGGLVINGEILKGNHYSAGEFSYICMDYNRWEEADTMAGALCSAVNFVKAVQMALPEYKLKNGQEVFELVKRKHPVANKLFREFLRKVVVQIYNLQIMFDPEVIAIGGGISRQELLLAALQEELDRFYAEGYWTKDNQFLPRPKLTICKFFNEANLIGAMYHYLKREGLLSTNFK